MKRDMRRHDKEMTELEQVDDPAVSAEGGSAEELLPATGEAGPERVAASGSGEAGSVELVPKAEFDQMKGERDQLIDRVARLQAEFDNARKRAEREKAEFREYATGSVIEQFLPVMDNFELALKSNSNAHQLRSGVALIVKQMEDVLRQLQVTPVATVGEEFDPRVHEALGSVERDDVPDQHVADEIRRGYKLRERLLRPAMVRVAHNPKQVSE